MKDSGSRSSLTAGILEHPKISEVILWFGVMATSDPPQHLCLELFQHLYRLLDTSLSSESKSPIISFRTEEPADVGPYDRVKVTRKTKQLLG